MIGSKKKIISLMVKNGIKYHETNRPFTFGNISLYLSCRDSRLLFIFGSAMTEKQFFKNFKKHCEIARDLGNYYKQKMINSLNEEICPFCCDQCKQINTPKCNAKCDYLFELKSYYNNSIYYNHIESKPITKMINILKSIPWKK